MSLTYFKRFRMEVDLAEVPEPEALPPGFFWVSWSTPMVAIHAQVKYRCFVDELDSQIFPCLGDQDGCYRLMEDISSRKGFLPGATWLIRNTKGYVATIQGVIDRQGLGMIQNVGVVPEQRGLGLGEALCLKALEGFREAGLTRGMLEVTAQNTVALGLYRRLGFRRAKTVYKAVDVA